MKKTLDVGFILTTLILILSSGSMTSIAHNANALPLLALDGSNTNTPIKHLVILFQENISFDHYFATYPNAINLPGEPNFSPSPNTPSVNGLNSVLLNQNPNSANPVRLDRSQVVTCDMNHGYTAEQNAYHGGANKFVEWLAAESGHLPAVSFLKAPSYQSAHAGFASSNPLDEQKYLVNTINRLQKIPQWNNTAIIITYDDSDGWYDHVMPPIVGSSKDLKFDRISDSGHFGNTTTTKGPFQDRCGYGPRLPFLIISPWAKVNFVDHTLTDQTSIIRFIEDNWSLGRIGNNSYDSKAGSILNMFDFNTDHKHASNVFLDPSTGTSISTRG